MTQKRRKYSGKTRCARGKALTALALAASAFHGFAPSPVAFAEGPQPGSDIRFEYFNYREKQSGESRMKVSAPMAYVRSALSDKTEIEGSFVLDGVSGASPMYHDTLSGASGKGIEDRRTAEDISLTHYFDQFSLTAGLSASSEDDYESLGGSLETRVWSSDHNTLVSFGISRSNDRVSSTNNPALDEGKDSVGGGVGVTQVIDQNTVVQSNLTFSSSDGFLDDPYKTLDSRPRSREQGAWLTRYVTYFPESEGALHLDYRFYRDSWAIAAHTFEVAWHQSLKGSWILAPHIRLYSQNKADFYSNEFPPESPGEGFFTADHRLGGFGGITTGLSVTKDLGGDLSASLMCDYMEQRGSWKIGSPGSPGLDPFSAVVIGFGLHWKFS